MKRFIDIAVSLTALIILAPVFAIVAVMIKLDSRGPVLFRQDRVGRGMRRFRLYKFRTMRHEPAGSSTSLLTIEGDERITRFGAFVRKAKLDEFPQLLNVLRGDMSVVGPRPEVPRYVEMFAKDYEIVLGVRPGLTDPASFKYRNEGTLLKRAADPEREYVDHILPDKIRLAKNYVAEASLSLDIIIIVKTLLEAVGMEAAPIGNAILRRRRPLVVLIHLLLIVSSYYLAWSLRFDGAIPPREVRLFWQFLPWLLLLRASAFIPFRLYEGLWRYTSVSDAANILAAVVSSSVPFVILVRGMYGESAHPRSVFVIDALLLVGLACGVRLLRRAYHELAAGPPGSKVVIVGAGDTGEAAIRELKKNYEYRVVALLDDDSTKRGRRIHGVQVVGGCEDLPRVVAERRPSEVLIAIDDPPDVLLRDLGRMLEPFSVKLTRLSRPEWCGGPVRVELPPRMPERSAVTRPTPPARNRVDVPIEVRRQQCPRCGHAELRRSRARTVIERLRRSVSRERPFRCQECQWRGWLIPLDYAILDAGAPEATLPDLRSLDAAFPPPSERRDHPEPDLV